MLTEALGPGGSRVFLQVRTGQAVAGAFGAAANGACREREFGREPVAAASAAKPSLSLRIALLAHFG